MISVDNAKANDVLICILSSLLVQKFSIQFVSGNAHIRCLAHVVNLVVQKILSALGEADDPEIKATMKRSRNLRTRRTLIPMTMMIWMTTSLQSQWKLSRWLRNQVHSKRYVNYSNGSLSTSFIKHVDSCMLLSPKSAHRLNGTICFKALLSKPSRMLRLQQVLALLHSWLFVMLRLDGITCMPWLSMPLFFRRSVYIMKILFPQAWDPTLLGYQYVGSAMWTAWFGPSASRLDASGETRVYAWGIIYISLESICYKSNALLLRFLHRWHFKCHILQHQLFLGSSWCMNIWTGISRSK